MMMVQGSNDWIADFSPAPGRTAYAIGTVEAWNALSAEDQAKFAGGRVSGLPASGSYSNREYHMICDMEVWNATPTMADSLFAGHYWRVVDNRATVSSTFRLSGRWIGASAVQNVIMQGVRSTCIVNELAGTSTMQDCASVDGSRASGATAQGESSICVRLSNSAILSRCAVIGGTYSSGQFSYRPIVGGTLSVSGAIVEDCCSVGLVMISGPLGSSGLACFAGSGCIVSRCYSTSNKTLDNISSTYLPINGVTPPAESSYYALGDPALYRQNPTGSGTLKTLEELGDVATYDGWDFETVWRMGDGGLPVLRWLYPEPVVVAEPINSHTCTLRLGMQIVEGHADNLYIYDYGADTDAYTYAGTWITEGRTFPERERSETVVFPEDLYPFGPHIPHDTPLYTYPEYRGPADSGKYHQWFMRAVPPVVPVPFNGGTPCGGVTGFRFGTIHNCPVPECQPSDVYRMRYNRIGTVTREYDAGPWTERKRAAFEWRNVETVAARSVLWYITTQARSFMFSVDFGDLDRMGPWRDLADTVVNVKLSSPDVEIVREAGGLWNIRIELQRVGD